jgi:hypothetical protein
LSHGVEQNGASGRLVEQAQGHSGAPVPITMLPDTRDQRDPQELGRTLLQVKTLYSTRTLSQVYDLECDVMDRIPNYDPSPVDHAADRQRELEKRAAEGDCFAVAVLRGDTLAEDPVD